MADDAYLLSGETVRRLAKLTRRYLGAPERGRNRPKRGFSLSPPPMRTGYVYSEISAGGDARPGTGEVIFDRIDRENREFVDADDTNPIVVYNTSPVTLPVGARVLCLWDQAMVRSFGQGANASLRPEAGWIALGGQVETPIAQLNSTESFVVLGTYEAPNEIGFESWVTDDPSFEPIFFPEEDGRFDIPQVAGVLIKEDAKYLIMLSVTVYDASQVGDGTLTLTVTGGVTEDLCPRLRTKTGVFRLTLNDTSPPSGTNPIGDDVPWQTFNICEQRGRVSSSYQFAATLNAGDKIRLWHEHFVPEEPSGASFTVSLTIIRLVADVPL